MALSKAKNQKRFWIDHGGDELMMWLVQVDLAGHSIWAKNLASRVDSRNLRVELAMQLDSGLLKFCFFRAHWAGDGGLFVANVNDTKAHTVVSALDHVHEIFARWQASHANTGALEMRVSCHKATIMTHNDPAFWFSEALNTFLKHERRIGVEGGSTITDEVFRSLSSTDQSRWSGGTARQLDPGNSWHLYYDRKRNKAEEEIRSFVRWLHSSVFNKFSNRAKDISRHKEAIAACEDLLFVASPLSAQGFSDHQIELEQVDSAAVSWASGCSVPLQSKSASQDFPKACIVMFRPPKSDDPVLLIKYVIGYYRAIYDFNIKLITDNAAWNQYQCHAFAKERFLNALPINLAIHVLVIVRDTSGQVWFLACQRAHEAGQVDTACGDWSISVEEQFRPMSQKVGGQEEHSDQSLAACAARGVREELNVQSMFTVELHGLFVEADNFNFGCLAAAFLDASLSEVQKACGGGVDSCELAAIVAIPLDTTVIQKLLSDSTGFDPSRLQSARTLWGTPTRSRWHKSSPARLALAYWLAAGRR